MGIDDVNDLIDSSKGSGVPIFKFANVGDGVRGVLLDASTQDQTKPGGEVVIDDRTGKPKRVVILTLQTHERDPEIEDDEGKRRVFLQGKGFYALVTALSEAGAQRLQVGATVGVLHDGLQPATKRGFSPAKCYTVKYSAPEGDAKQTPSAQDILG